MTCTETEDDALMRMCERAGVQWAGWECREGERKKFTLTIGQEGLAFIWVLERLKQSINFSECSLPRSCPFRVHKRNVGRSGVQLQPMRKLAKWPWCARFTRRLFSRCASRSTASSTSASARSTSSWDCGSTPNASALLLDASVIP